MARKLTNQGEVRDDWRRLIPPLVANAADVPHLEAPRVELETIDTEVEGLLAQQAVLTSQKQEVSRRLRLRTADGRRLATFLRTGIKQHYGIRSEKLAEFNLQPFRGRKKVEPEEPGEVPQGV